MTDTASACFLSLLTLNLELTFFPPHTDHHAYQMYLSDGLKSVKRLTLGWRAEDCRRGQEIVRFPITSTPALRSRAISPHPYMARPLDRVQNTEAKIAQHKNDSTWETLTQRTQVARVLLSSKRTREDGLGRL
jgi:hypothetical protein